LLWQAHCPEKKLNDLGYKTEILAVKSTGDIILDKYYELGITGIFTKTLDVYDQWRCRYCGAFHEGCSYGMPVEVVQPLF
jgi:hypothetical protein